MRRRLVDVCALVVGALGLAFVVRELGWDGIERSVIGTGWWFVAIAVVDVASIACDAFAIHGLVSARTPLRYVHAFVAEASGLAINRVTPGNYLGEPVKVAMLVRHVAGEDAVAAVLLLNLITMYVSMAVIIVGLPVSALVIALPEGTELAAWGVCGALIAAAAVVAVLVRRGALGATVDAARWLRVISAARHARWRAAVVRVDDLVRTPAGLGRGVIGVAGSRTLNMAGTVLVMHACGIALTPALVIASLSVGVVVRWLSNVVPLGLGLADGANYILYDLLGATARAGLLFTMVNRLRTCVLAAFGFVVMAASNVLHDGARSTKV